MIDHNNQHVHINITCHLKITYTYTSSPVRHFEFDSHHIFKFFWYVLLFCVIVFAFFSTYYSFVYFCHIITFSSPIDNSSKNETAAYPFQYDQRWSPICNDDRILNWALKVFKWILSIQWFQLNPIPLHSSSNPLEGLRTLIPSTFLTNSVLTI